MPSNKQWYELLGQHIRADVDERGNDSFAIFSRNSQDKYTRDLPLSPVTNFLLNVWGCAIQDNKSLILNFPDNMIKSIPLLAFMYSNIKSKSTLVFTSGNSNLKTHISGMHNRAYHLLSWENGSYVYNDVPMGIITRDSLESRPHMIHATNVFKQQNRERLKKELLSSDKPKILLNGTDNATRITSTIKNIFMDDEQVNESNLNLDLDVGCLIFENADRYINSNYMAERFIDWLKETVSEDIIVLLHFSNSNLKFISDIKEATNSLIMPFNQSILRNNTALSNPSLEYFDNVSFSDLKILNNYNLDNAKNYNFDFNISIAEPLEKGNLDLFLRYSYDIINDINPDTLKNKNFFYRTINLLYSLNNLAINPSFYKFNTQIAPNSWRYINVPQFIGLFASKLSRENDVNQFLLKKLISNLNNFYQELFKTKRFGEDKTYNRIGKDCQLLDIIYNKNKYFEDDKPLLVGLYQNTEPKVLNKVLNEVEDVEITYLSNLFYNYKDMSNYNLLLPGIVPPKYFSILKRPFNQVLIQAYEGSNSKIIQNQIDLVLNPTIEVEKIAMDYFAEIYDFIGESKNNFFFNDFNKRYNELSEVADEPVVEEEQKGVTIKELFEFSDNYRDYAKGRKLSDHKLETTISTESSSSNREYDYSTTQINLRNLIDDAITTKNLFNHKKYLRFKSYDKLNDALEVRPTLLQRNDYVIVLDDNKSFLDIYMDIFGEDRFVDRDSIDYWKDRLYEYKEKNDLKYKEFFDEYKNYCSNHSFRSVSYQTFRLWINGYTISPNNKEDLLILGKFLEDDEIIKNYKDMAAEAENLRNLNRNMGRKLSHIIKSIIQNSGMIDYNRLSMEERYIYDMIKNSVYQVV